MGYLTRRHWRFVLLVLGFVMVLAACGGGQATPPPTATRPSATSTTAVATATPAATATSQAQPTATRPASVATSTPRPSATTQPTAAASPASGGAKPVVGGTLVASWWEPPQWDSHQTTTPDIAVTMNTNDYLLVLDNLAGDSVQPELAKSWTISTDGTVITFNLVNGVTFHDGSPLTCDDVLYSFQRIITPPKGMISARGSAMKPVKGLECVDPATFRATLQRPWPDALVNFATPGNIIFPKKVAEPNDKAGKFMKQDIIGSGAFKLSRLSSGESIEVVRNPNYWKPGLPYLDSVKWVFIPATQMATIAASFQSGRIEYYKLFDSPSLASDLQKASAGRWTVFNWQSPSRFFNFIPDVKKGSGFQDVRLRKAAALALDQKTFIDTLCPLAFVCWQNPLLPLSSQFALPEKDFVAIPGYGSDTAGRRAEARQILKELGQEGFKVTLYARGLDKPSVDAALTGCDLLAKGGFKCDVQNLEDGPYFDMMNNTRMAPGGAAIHGIGFAATGPDAIIGHAFHPAGARNYGAYDDQKLRDLFDQQSKEQDVAKRVDLLRQYQVKFLTQYYHVILGWRGSASFWWNYLRGPILRTEPAVSYTQWPGRMTEVWKAPH